MEKENAIWISCSSPSSSMWYGTRFYDFPMHEDQTRDYNVTYAQQQTDKRNKQNKTANNNRNFRFWASNLLFKQSSDIIMKKHENRIK